MYLPTFWKMYAEAFMHKGMKAAGWGLPAGCMGKSPNKHAKLKVWKQDGPSKCNRSCFPL